MRVLCCTVLYCAVCLYCMSVSLILGLGEDSSVTFLNYEYFFYTAFFLTEINYAM